MNKKIVVGVSFLLIPILVFASEKTQNGISVFGIPLEFILFAFTLIGIALFHRHTLVVALSGLFSILVLKLGFPDFDIGQHLNEEWPILVNLFLLLLGFALLSSIFEDSALSLQFPKFLPGNWYGPFILLSMVFVLSAFLDNIAAALIGGSLANVVFRGKVHPGFLAAIVAASNGGGSGSVIGDTTTTMMWIDGVAAQDVLHAFVAAVPALIFFGMIASRQQQRLQPVMAGSAAAPKIKINNLLSCLLILSLAILANLLLDFPAIGVWVAIALSAPFVKLRWEIVKKALPGSVFLLALVFSASMMPVDRLPPASWHSAFALGFISSVFDNIPLTKLALDQGGFDWGMLAFAVGFGGSMIWFGSSAGVAMSNKFPEAKSVGRWLRHGWHVAVAYVLGFGILMLTLGWNAHDENRPAENMDEIKPMEIDVQRNPSTIQFF